MLNLLLKFVFQRVLSQEPNVVLQESTAILGASSFFMGVAIKVIIEKFLKVSLGLIYVYFIK